MASDLPVSPGDVAAAAERLRGSVAATPSLRSAQLSRVTGATVVVKCENLQFTGSFKERGARNRLSTLTDAERGRGVIAVSAGNHALAVAHHAGVLGIDCTVVMPATTPWAKVAPIEGFGAAVVLSGETFDDARARADALELESGAVRIPPFDDVDVIAGQGTVALELLDAAPDLDVLVVPVGGGGLLAGIAVAAKDRRPDLHIVGVQSELFPSLVREPTREVPARATIAEGIAVKQPGALTRPIIAALVDDMLAVARVAHRGGDQPLPRDGEARRRGRGRGRARRAARISRAFPRPHRRPRPQRRQHRPARAGAGDHAHPRAHGRITHLTLQLPDRPGSLMAVAAVVAAQGANIISVSHDRYRPELALRVAELELTVETRDSHHRDDLVLALREAGFPPVVPPRDAGDRSPPRQPRSVAAATSRSRSKVSGP